MSAEDTPKTLSDLMDRPVWHSNADVKDGDSNPDKDAAAPPDEDVKIATPDASPDALESPDIADAADQTDQPKKYKYASWDAAEVGAKEAQSWGTKKAQEAADLRRETERLRTEIEEKRRSELEAQRPKVVTKEEQAAELKKALDAIDILDPESPEYTAQRAQLLADAMMIPNMPYVDEFTIEEKVRSEMEKIQKAQSFETSQAKLVAEAESLAAAAGLTMKRGGNDYTLFWDALNRAPMGEGVTLEQQVESMIKEVQKVKSGYREEWMATLTAEQKKQMQNAPLERHSTPTRSKQPDDTPALPLTVSAIMESQRIKRKI
jgi:hypothetical protein